MKIVARSLREEHDKWHESDERRLKHTSGAVVYVGVRPLMLTIDSPKGQELRLTFLEKWTVWRAVNAWKRERIRRLIEDGEMTEHKPNGSTDDKY